ncbi:MAG TPA: DUF2630 family protein [Micromonosporaceae bacterium]|jgi:hypothetical protein|nr:DUF2630 family protein [Micromonosporaceae bacterium]
MQDGTIQQRISDLVAEEHTLRRAMQDGQINTDTEHARLRQLEVELDQCWDLLRRRRAARDNRENPDSVAVRPASEVEGYRQ